MTQNASARDDQLVGMAEWGWVALNSVVILLITSISYAVAWVSQTPDRVFGGFNFLLDDAFSYLAKMRQGAGGAWLFHIVYTPELHAGAFLFPFHMLLGRLATLLPGGDLTANMVWTYHGARVAFGAGLLATTYRFLAQFTLRISVRRLAWVSVALGGGLGWVLVGLGRHAWLDSVPLDLYLPEAFTYLILYSSPHIALAQILLLCGALLLLKAWRMSARPEVGVHPATRNAFSEGRMSSWAWAVLAGLMWLIMGLVVPFYVVVAWAVTGAAWVALGLRSHRLLWRHGFVAGVAMVISVPVVAYSVWVFTGEPVYASWAAQNRILSPHPLHYLVAYGVPLVLAAFAVRGAWRSERPAWFALAWVGVVPVLAYLPFNLQRRLVQGVQVPLCLLAAMGAVRLWESKGRRLLIRRFLVSGMLATMVPTSLLFLATSGAWMHSRPPLVFREGAEIDALEWLAGQSGSEDVVLASYETGNYIPARVETRVFLGHGLETVNAVEKQAQVVRFFDEATEHSWREHLLAQHGVDYVFWGPLERALGDFDPHGASYLEQRYDRDGYAVFEVE